MVQLSSALCVAASLLAALPVNADGLYTKKSPVLQLNQKSYKQLIANSNYSSVCVAPSEARFLRTELTSIPDSRVSSQVLRACLQAVPKRSKILQVLRSMVRPLPELEACLRESGEEPGRTGQGCGRQLR